LHFLRPVREAASFAWKREFSLSEEVSSRLQSITEPEYLLKDKVALLFDGTHTGGRTLAVSLARYGVDIVIVYRKVHARQAQETKILVEAEGRRCLLIRAQNNDETFSKNVLHQTVNTLGRLDIFIDYSSLSGEEMEEVRTGIG
jgi:hypothetical protein